MKQSDAHKKAIKIITSDNVNWKELIIKIAQDNPAVLCKANDDVNQVDQMEDDIKKNNDIFQEIFSELRVGRKIQAIKIYKSFRDVGLREAKEYIDNLSSKLNL